MVDAGSAAGRLPGGLRDKVVLRFRDMALAPSIAVVEIPLVTMVVTRTMWWRPPYTERVPFHSCGHCERQQAVV